MSIKSLLASILLLPLACATAIACSCAGVSGDILFEKADAVFAGRVIRVEGQQITFEVEKSWKHVQDRQVMVSDSGEMSCRYGFSEGGSYIIPADLKDGALYTHMCMGIGGGE